MPSNFYVNTPVLRPFDFSKTRRTLTTLLSFQYKSMIIISNCSILLHDKSSGKPTVFVSIGRTRKHNFFWWEIFIIIIFYSVLKNIMTMPKETNYTICLLQLSRITSPIRPGGGGGGVLPIMAYTGRLRHKGYLFRLQVYERGGILLVKVYKRVGKYVI